MPALHPLPKAEAAPEVHGLYDALTKKFGFMPNFFAIMAHRPKALKQFVDLYGTVTSEGTVEAKYKELAYLKTSVTNGCQY